MQGTHGLTLRRRAISLAAACIGSLSVAAGTMPARALDASAIEGRWQTADSALIIDISRCGGEFCGRRVVLASQGILQCERMVFTAKINDQVSAANFLRLEGKLDLADKGGTYRTLINVPDELGNSATVMRIEGSNDRDTLPDTLLLRRAMVLEVSMARVGDAMCKPVPTS